MFWTARIRWFFLFLLALTLTGLVACGKTDLTDAEHVVKAKQFQAEGDLQATLIELKSALQKNPKNLEGRLMLGELYLNTGNGVAAEKELKRAEGLGASGSYLARLMGKALLLQRRYEEVLKLSAGSGTEDDIDLMVLRARALEGLDEFAKARRLFERVLGKQPENAEALLGLATLEFREGNDAAAKKLLARLLKDDASNIDALILQGKIQLRDKEDDAALASFQQAVDVLGKTTLVTSRGMQARTYLAKSLILKRRYDDARKQIDYLLKVAPRHPQPNFLAGLLAYEQGRRAESVDYFLKVLQVAPDDLPTLFLLGSANFSLGNLEQAEQQLVRVLAERPGLLPARLLLARVRLKQEEGSAALEALEPALAQDPDNLRLLAMAGQAAMRSGDLEKGREYLRKVIAKRPDADRVRSQLAMLYLAEGNDELAIQELERAIRDGKTPGRERALLALTYLRKKDYENALATARELASRHADKGFPHNLVGIVLLAKGDIEPARKAFADALKAEPGFVPAAMNLARLDVMDGNTKAARERLEAILGRDDKNVSAMMALAQLAESLGDQERALEWVENARAVDARSMAPRLVLARYYLRAGQPERARKIAREAVAIDGRNPLALKLLGQVELESKDYTAAVVTFEKLVRQAPDAENHFLLAIAQFNAGAVSAARQSVDEALQRQPDHLRALSLRVLIEARQGQMAAAARTVDRIKRMHSKSPAGYLLEGDVLVSRKQDAKAAAAYAKARELGGGTAALLKEVAALQRSRSAGEAIKRLKTWLDAHGNDVAARYTLAVAYYAQGRRDDAIKEYRYLLEVSPQHVPTLNNLAWLLLEEKQLESARELAEKARDLEPENGAVLDTLGWIRLQQGESREALALLRQAVDRMPESGDARYHLAEALVRSGKRDEARDILEELLATDRPFPSQSQARQLYDAL